VDVAASRLHITRAKYKEERWVHDFASSFRPPFAFLLDLAARCAAFAMILKVMAINRCLCSDWLVLQRF
jgi:hypothetical protein